MNWKNNTKTPSYEDANTLSVLAVDLERCATINGQHYILFLFLLLVACGERESRPALPPHVERKGTPAPNPRIEIDTVVVVGDSLMVVGRALGLPRAMTRRIDDDASAMLVDYRLIDSAGDTLGRGFVTAEGKVGEMNDLRDHLPIPIDFAGAGRIEFYIASRGERTVASREIDLTNARRGGATSIVVYFRNIYMEGRGDCESVFPVTRLIRRSPRTIQDAVGALLKGPTSEEMEKGYRTALPGGLRLQRVTLDSGIARMTFNSEIDRTLDSCSAAMMRLQIRMTVAQFSRVRDMEMKVAR